MKVIDLLEHRDIVKDIPLWEKSVEQGFTSKPWSICISEVDMPMIRSVTQG